VRFVRLGLLAVACAVVGCTPDYSPNVYSPVAMQQASKVARGVVIGFRQVQVAADGTVGAVTGGAAGGILGAQTGNESVTRGLGAVGGALAGGIIGTAVEHTVGNSIAWEYIVRETNGDLVSVTQWQPKPLPVGQDVLVITGKQARIIPDYAASAAPKAKADAASAKPAAATAAAPAKPATPTAPPVATASAAATAAAPIPITPPSPSTPTAAPNAAPPSVPSAAFVSPAPSSAPASSSSGSSAATSSSPAH
jgi:outer membrane lipoprotein SlyB